jgi:hypothetical protein
MIHLRHAHNAGQIHVTKDWVLSRPLTPAPLPASEEREPTAVEVKLALQYQAPLLGDRLIARVVWDSYRRWFVAKA